MRPVQTGVAGAFSTSTICRWTMILLVISMHAADTYSPFGNWYYVERPTVTAIETLVFGAWQTYLQSFFMGLLFFVAGFFVPASYDRKGFAALLARPSDPPWRRWWRT